MTTIAFRDGIMAADSRAYSGDKHPIGDKRKVFLIDGANMLVGISSSIVGAPTLFMNWLAPVLLANQEKDPNCIVADTEHPVQALMVKPDGTAYYWNDGRAWTGPVKADFYAIGSGQQSAYMAMMLGKSAAEAVELTMGVDPWTGGEVFTMGFDK